MRGSLSLVFIARTLGIALFLGLAFVADVSASDEALTSPKVQYFEKYVRPLLEKRCLECHSQSSEDVGGSLFLDARGGWKKGGDLGAAIVPGKPEKSLVIQAVQHSHPDLEMPPSGKLSAAEIRILVEWVRSGAADPRDGQVFAKPEIDLETGRQHWAFQSPHGKLQSLPRVALTAWPKNELDFFVLSKLEEQGLAPNPAADKRTLLRRLTFDLIGLPPTPAEIDDFLADASPGAYARQVERLLASPRYGERWGRHWLDVARYADSNGLDENIAHGNAWRYRDYVIDALNADKPFDHFVREQLAGDLLPTVKDADLNRQRIIATGFLSLGPKVLAEVDETKMEMDIVDEQVEVVGRAFMGLTLGCARCHDHKFDPISTEDYYALAGIFKSTKTMEHFTKIARWNEVCLDSQTQIDAHASLSEKIELHEKRIQELEAWIKRGQNKEGLNKNVDSDASEELVTLKQELKEFESRLPELQYAMSVQDYEQATDLRVHVRGNALQQTNLVPRRFPEVLVAKDSTLPQFGQQESGRRQLAAWLVSGRHPLVARVLVNRIWRWHFGRGLVESTDNFGELGDRSHNQELLDWLAVRFVEDGWSIKQLHRHILNSATYQMSSASHPVGETKDPENIYQWRASVRRLEAEAIRDSVLFVSGQLDASMGQSLLHVKNREFLFDHTSKDQTKYDSTRRSVYLPVIRNHLYDGFQLFDYSDASVTNSNRTTTAVAPQALFLMNSDLVSLASRSFAQIICDRFDADAAGVDFAYQLAFGRKPTDEQSVRTLDYLVEVSQELTKLGESDRSRLSAWQLFCHALLMSNEFIHVN